MSEDGVCGIKETLPMSAFCLRSWKCRAGQETDGKEGDSRENMQHRMGVGQECIRMSGDEGVSRKECGRRGVGARAIIRAFWLVTYARGNHAPNNATRPGT